MNASSVRGSRFDRSSSCARGQRTLRGLHRRPRPAGVLLLTFLMGLATAAFGTAGAVLPGSVAVGEAETGPCVEDASTLCLKDGRFQVEVSWEDFQGGSGAGQALPQTRDSGLFWFFDPDNVELVVKVIDGRPVNGHFWFFYGALSNVAYSIRVTDTQTGRIKTYLNPARNFASFGDTEAFADPTLCGGIVGLPCGEGEFCDLPPGTCGAADLFGTCLPRPDVCTEEIDPVCGCDGVTYGNDCLRQQVGAPLDHPGSC